MLLALEIPKHDVLVLRRLRLLPSRLPLSLGHGGIYSLMFYAEDAKDPGSGIKCRAQAHVSVHRGATCEPHATTEQPPHYPRCAGNAPLTVEDSPAISHLPLVAREDRSRDLAVTVALPVSNQGTCLRADCRPHPCMPLRRVTSQESPHRPQLWLNSSTTSASSSPPNSSAKTTSSTTTSNPGGYRSENDSVSPMRRMFAQPSLE